LAPITATLLILTSLIRASLMGIADERLQPVRSELLARIRALEKMDSVSESSLILEIS